jgi:hypothetical protein
VSGAHPNTSLSDWLLGAHARGEQPSLEHHLVLLVEISLGVSNLPSHDEQLFVVILFPCVTTIGIVFATFDPCRRMYQRRS